MILLPNLVWFVKNLYFPYFLAKWWLLATMEKKRSTCLNFRLPAFAIKLKRLHFVSQSFSIIIIWNNMHWISVPPLRNAQPTTPSVDTTTLSTLETLWFLQWVSLFHCFPRLKNGGLQKKFLSFGLICVFSSFKCLQSNVTRLIINLNLFSPPFKCVLQ